MARSKFEDLVIVSEGNGFEVRTHVSSETQANGGAPKVSKSGQVIQYPISRVGRTDTNVDVNALINSLESAFQDHWDNYLEVPSHVEYPSLAYRIAIGLGHAHSLEHADRWPSGTPTYRYASFAQDLESAIDASSDVASDSTIQDLKSTYPEYFTRWTDEYKAAKAREDKINAL
tara:strand:+ start:835 stop:1356 length:522 start_codon:yes stop_codon:yes gene_type:complete